MHHKYLSRYFVSYRLSKDYHWNLIPWQSIVTEEKQTFFDTFARNKSVWKPSTRRYTTMLLAGNLFLELFYYILRIKGNFFFYVLLFLFFRLLRWFIKNRKIKKTHLNRNISFCATGLRYRLDVECDQLYQPPKIG